VKITAIRLARMRLPLDPPFDAAWDPVPRRHFPDAPGLGAQIDHAAVARYARETLPASPSAPAPPSASPPPPRPRLRMIVDTNLVQNGITVHDDEDRFHRSRDASK
jgi:hypothetical protein